MALKCVFLFFSIFSIHEQPLPRGGNFGRERGCCTKTRWHRGRANQEKSFSEKTQKAENDDERLNIINKLMVGHF